MMKVALIASIAFLSVGMMTMAGCEKAEQARTDYYTGLSTPLGAGEHDPRKTGALITNIVSAFSPQAAGLLGGVFTVFGAWFRGRKIRKGLPPSTVGPVTGALGPIPEGIVQQFSNLFLGLFNFGPNGGKLKRGAKVLAVGGVAGLLTNLPWVVEFVKANDGIFGLVLVVLMAIVAMLDKALGNVKPLAPKPAQ